jgi:hypothetical protein
MKVYVNGFYFESSGIVTPAAFLGELVHEGVREFEHSKKKRVLALERRGHFYVGVLISQRDQTNFVTISQDVEHGFVIEVSTTPEGKAMADFNFFAIDGRSGHGLFTAYRGSGGLTMFGNIMAKQYREISTRIGDRVAEEHSESGETETADEEQALRKQYRKGHLQTTAMIKNPDFKNELRKLKKITAFEYVEPTVQDSRFGSVRKSITKVRRRCYFISDEHLAGKLIRFLGKFVADNAIGEGEVVGRLNNGDSHSVPINPEAYCFTSYPYDDVARPENIRLQGLGTSPMIKKLLALIEAHEELFTPTEE